jgi:transcriptional antiterminator RfaH
MPVLPLQSSLHPENLLDSPDLASAGECEWWVLHTKPRCEKTLARRLHHDDCSYYLPMYLRNRRVKGVIRERQVPLFSSYLFLRGDRDARQKALATNLVANSLYVADRAALLRTLVGVRQMLKDGSKPYPEKRVLRGMAVEIIDGPLEGMTGKVVRRGGSFRFLIEVNFLQQGVSVEIDRRMFQPISKKCTILNELAGRPTFAF